jgi:hypothetical protein
MWHAWLISSTLHGTNTQLCRTVKVSLKIFCIIYTQKKDRKKKKLKKKKRKKPKIILHRAEELFPSLKDSLKFPHLPKLAQGHCSENVTLPHHAYQVAITNDKDMKNTKEKNISEVK